MRVLELKSSSSNTVEFTVNDDGTFEIWIRDDLSGDSCLIDGLTVEQRKEIVDFLTSSWNTDLLLKPR